MPVSTPQNAGLAIGKHIKTLKEKTMRSKTGRLLFPISLVLLPRQSTCAIAAFGSMPSSTPIRVLCYGDSLTAGTAEDYREYPYAQYLEKQLHEQGLNDVVVRHVGLPGWTASLMLDGADGARGLRTTIRRIQDPSLSLVILLAGTNDLGHGADADEIFDSVISLHKLCYQEGVPQTLAVGVPASRYQAMNGAAASTIHGVNSKLSDYANQESRFVYTPFPFGYADTDSKWASDGLHFTKEGYKTLGEKLSPIVNSILCAKHSQV